MSRFQAERLLLGCATDSAVLLSVARTPTPPALEMLASVRVEQANNAAGVALCSALSGLKPEPPKSGGRAVALSVTLADGLARSFVVTPPSGAQGLRELRASAAARFAALYGEPAEQWRFAADWQSAAPFITCALPRELYQALDQLARTHGWRLESVSTALVRVWNRLCVSIPADGWLLVGFGQTVTLVHNRHGQVADLRTLRLPVSPDLAELETLLEQERLRASVGTETSQRQSLLWTGAAAWLPAATAIAGLASHTIRLPGQSVQASEWSEAQQLALAGSQR